MCAFNNIEQLANHMYSLKILFFTFRTLGTFNC